MRDFKSKHPSIRGHAWLYAPRSDGRCYVSRMPIRARVPNACIVVDEPTLLPEGTPNLVVDDEKDELDEAEQGALSKHLLAGWKSAQAGRLRSAAELLAELRNKRA